MNSTNPVTPEEVSALLKRLEREAAEAGYHLNPDQEFTGALVESLLANERRYGYLACPCRLASGTREEDQDIVCPCDYRDPDLNQHGSCYCALYVSPEIARGERKAGSIPERRRLDRNRKPSGGPVGQLQTGPLEFPVWRCSVCGYLCAREEPPEICPICKVKKERFSRFL